MHSPIGVYFGRTVGGDRDHRLAADVPGAGGSVGPRRGPACAIFQATCGKLARQSISMPMSTMGTSPGTSMPATQSWRTRCRRFGKRRRNSHVSRRSEFRPRLADPNQESSYVINEYVFGREERRRVVVAESEEHFETDHLFEAADKMGTVTNDHVHCSTWYSAFNIENGFVWPAITGEINPPLHVDSANYLFADDTWKRSANRRCTKGCNSTSSRAPILPTSAVSVRHQRFVHIEAI